MKPDWSLPFRYLVGALLFLGLIGVLFYAREALEPVVIAAFIAYLINPAVAVLSRNTRIKRRTAVNLVYFSALALLIAVPATITPIFFDELTGVAQDLMSLLAQFQVSLSQPVTLAGLEFDLTQLAASLGQFRSMTTTPVPEEAFLLLESTSRGAIWFLVIIVLVYLFLSEWHTTRHWLLSLAPEAYRAEVETLYGRVRDVWMAYLRGQILLMLIVGVVFTIAWYILGIPGAFVLGVIAGLFTLVPDLGPILAVALAMGVALLEGSNWIPLSNAWVTVIVFLVYFVLINLKNMWLRPVIMGRMVHMNEGLIFVAILVATILNGILGALLVVPVLASTVIIINYLLRRVLNQSPYEDSPLKLVKEPPTRASRPLHRIRKINRN
jgi:predicted PurR-regulated permease PerM